MLIEISSWLSGSSTAPRSSRAPVAAFDPFAVLTATRLEEFTGNGRATLRDRRVRRKWRYSKDSSVVGATRKISRDPREYRNYTALV
jgi:hypothetical protein